MGCPATPVTGNRIDFPPCSHPACVANLVNGFCTVDKNCVHLLHLTGHSCFHMVAIKWGTNLPRAHQKKRQPKTILVVDFAQKGKDTESHNTGVWDVNVLLSDIYRTSAPSTPKTFFMRGTRAKKKNSPPQKQKHQKNQQKHHHQNIDNKKVKFAWRSFHVGCFYEFWQVVSCQCQANQTGVKKENNYSQQNDLQAFSVAFFSVAFQQLFSGTIIRGTSLLNTYPQWFLAILGWELVFNPFGHAAEKTILHYVREPVFFFASSKGALLAPFWPYPIFWRFGFSWGTTLLTCKR